MIERPTDGAYSDFKIIASGTSFSVHRVVLHSASEYFKAMLIHGMQESLQGYCEISEDPNAVDQCIEFMYTKRMNLHLETVAKILGLSHQWLLSEAENMCIEFMQKNVCFDNCVEWINLSKLYGIRGLESTCMSFFLKNLARVTKMYELEIETLRSVLKKVRTDNTGPAKVLWNIVRHRIQHPDCHPCDLIQTFCVETLSKAEFEAGVLTDDHVSSCESCKEYATERRRAHLYTMRDIRLENCLTVKHQVTKYQAARIVKNLDKYIVKEFQKVCMRNEFLSLVTEEHLLTYICKIHRDCTKQEFDRIIDWIRAYPERECLCTKIFTLENGKSSKFKNSVQTLGQIEDQSFIDSANCCFLRYVAEKYSFPYIMECTEEFIQLNFETISTCSDIALLSVASMEKYVKCDALSSLNAGATIWIAVRYWAEQNERNTSHDFSRVFYTLPFEKFCIYLLQVIARDNLVKASVECCAKLIDVALTRISQNVSSHDSDVTAISQRLCDMQEIIERNGERLDNLQKYVQKIEGLDGSNNYLQSLCRMLTMQCNANKNSISSIETDLEEISDTRERNTHPCINKLFAKVADLKSENRSIASKMDKLRKQNTELKEELSRSNFFWCFILALSIVVYWTFRTV